MLARADIVPYFVLRPSRHADNVLGVTVEIFRLLLIRHRGRLVASRLSLTQGLRIDIGELQLRYSLLIKSKTQDTHSYLLRFPYRRFSTLQLLAMVRFTPYALWPFSPFVTKMLELSL